MHTLNLGGHVIRASRALQPTHAKIAAMAYRTMVTKNLSEIYVADFVKSAGDKMTGSTQARYQSIDRALRTGVEVDGEVLRLSKDEGGGRYDKTKKITREPGPLVAREGDDVEVDLDDFDDAEPAEGGAAAPGGRKRAAAEPEDPTVAGWTRELAEKVAARVKASESTNLLKYVRKAVEEDDLEAMDRKMNRALRHVEGEPFGAAGGVIAKRVEASELLPDAIRNVLEEVLDLVMQNYQVHVLAAVDARAKQAAAEEHRRLVLEARNELTRFARERVEVFDIRLTGIMSDIEKRLTEQLRLLEQATQSGLAQIKRATDLFALEYGDGEQKSQKAE